MVNMQLHAQWSPRGQVTDWTHETRRPFDHAHLDDGSARMTGATPSRIQYSDRALERLLARDVPSADVTAKDAAVCQSAPTTHPHNVPGILVSPFFSFTFRRGNCYHFCYFSRFSFTFYYVFL